jgi:AcrR family transcriptional regulator
MAVLSRRTPEREEQRKARRAAVQTRLMEATEELLREGHNYADLNVEAIAARAGISRTTFYDYFDDKRELLLTLAATVSEPFLREADEWRPGDDADQTRTELRSIIRALVRIYRHPVTLALIEAAFYDDAIRDAWRVTQQRHIERAIRLLTWENEGGRFQAHGSTIEARARVLHWSIHSTAVNEVALRQEIDEEDLIDALVDINILGVRGVLLD